MSTGKILWDKIGGASGAKGMFWSWIGGFLGIAAIFLLDRYAGVLSIENLTMLIGSFGASAVLAYGAIESPLAQPKNIIGGHILSALVGVTAFKLFGDNLWLAASVGVATAIVVMQLTNTVHPPGGATALIAVIGGDGIHSLGYTYALIPIGLGAVVLVAIALIVNNIPRGRSYPKEMSYILYRNKKK